MRIVEREAAVAFIFSRDDRLLVGNTVRGGAYEGMWIVPGGGIELGETPYDAVIREVAEEVGLNVHHAKIVQRDISTGESEKTLRDTGERVVMHMKFHNFEIHLDSHAQDVAVQPGDDFTNPKWVAIRELQTLKMPEPSVATLTRLGYISGASI